MKKYNLHNSLKKAIGSFLLIFFGSILTAWAINMFLDPYKLAPGGLSGLGIVLKHIFHWKIGLVMLILNIPIFAIGFFTVGAKFGWKTIIATIILSIAIDVTAPFVPRFHITKDVLLASIYGGVLSGVGLAMVFRAGATTGGTDLIAQILHKFFPSISIGKILMVCDGLVVVFSTMAFKNYELALYDILTIYITSKLIDTILEGVDFAKAVIIISNESDLIAERLINDLDRGVTGLNAMGMFKRVDKTVLFCVVKRAEVNEVKEITKSIDKNAFVILTDVREVLGEGFKAI